MPKPPENPAPNTPIAEQLEIIETVDTYTTVLSAVVELMEAARRATARSVNAIMTATYWEIGRRIVELEQRGESRAEYGKQIVERLAQDLGDLFGRGFQKTNLSPDPTTSNSFPLNPRKLVLSMKQKHYGAVGLYGS